MTVREPENCFVLFNDFIKANYNIHYDCDSSKSVFLYLFSRAEVQISLNEAREYLEQINKDIVQLGVNVTQLSEELTQESAEHETVKSNLKSTLADTIQKRNTQRKSNTILERDLILDKDDLKDCQDELNVQMRKLKRAEDNLSHAKSTLAMFDTESETNSRLIQNYSDKIPERNARKNAIRKEMNEKSEKYQVLKKPIDL